MGKIKRNFSFLLIVKIINIKKSSLAIFYLLYRFAKKFSNKIQSTCFGTFTSNAYISLPPFRLSNGTTERRNGEIKQKI